jgi:hypothetical protein
MGRPRRYQSHAERQKAYRARRRTGAPAARVLPYWASQDGRYRIYHADCLAALPTLAKGSVDAVVTDPPFHAGKAFANDGLPEAHWRAFCRRLASALKRLAAENVLVEVGKQDTAMRRALEAQLTYRWALALNYTNAMRNGAVGYANLGAIKQTYRNRNRRG